MARYFELLGLPGAGKTTLLRSWRPLNGLITVHQLVRRERLGSAAADRRSRFLWLLPKALKLRLLDGPAPDFWDAAQMAIDYPELHDLAVHISRRLQKVEDRRSALWMLIEAFSRYGFIQRVSDPTGAVIVDEGIWQRLLFPLAASDTPNSPTLSCLPCQLPDLDGVVVLDLPIGVAVQRVVNRKSEFQATEVMPAMAGLLPEMIEALRARAIPITIIDATRPPHESLADVRRFLAQRLAVRSP